MLLFPAKRIGNMLLCDCSSSMLDNIKNATQSQITEVSDTVIFALKTLFVNAQQGDDEIFYRRARTRSAARRIM